MYISHPHKKKKETLKFFSHMYCTTYLFLNHLMCKTVQGF